MSRIRDLLAVALLASYAVVPLLLFGFGLLLGVALDGVIPTWHDLLVQLGVEMGAVLAAFCVPAGLALALWTVRPGAAHWLAVLLGCFSVGAASTGLLLGSHDPRLVAGGLLLVVAAFPLGEAPRRLAR